ncbi:MAG: toxin-antitoxin system YwqK family antitoxin [Cyclobacteriaceae bacterium]
MNKAILFLCMALLLPVCAVVAQQEVTLYYDNGKSLPRETFTVLSSNPSVLDGPYTAFFTNGSIRIKGRYEKGQASGYWEYFYENGHPKMRGTLQDNASHGVWEYFYENGHPQMRGVLYDSIRSGPWQFFFENGTIRSEGYFEEDRKIGKWKYYYEDAALKAEENYQGDTVQYVEYYTSGSIKLEGQKINENSIGTWTSYYENGSLKSEGEYDEGERNGLWKFYHENGKLSSVGDFIDGSTVGKWTYYYENGKISAEGAEKDGVKEGYWKLYHNNGDFKGEAVFNEGEGAYREFYEDGSLKVKGYMVDGINQGKWLYYYPDGKLEGECVFKNGKGAYLGYYRDGSLKMKGTIEEGERTGVWELYKTDGTLAGYYKSIYEDNKPVFRTLNKADKAEGKSDGQNTALNPDYLYRKKSLRYFKPRINELQSVIVGINPLGLLMDRLPLSIEYYMQERLGYELEIGLERAPFFYSDKSVALGSIYTRGGFVALKQKFYHPDTRSGMFYFGHRLGFDYLYHNTNLNFTNERVREIVAKEQKISYVLLLGTRLIRDADMINTRITRDQRSSGLTFDLSAGLGIGYRFFQKAYEDNPQFDRMLNELQRSRVIFPIYLGATVGYAF